MDSNELALSPILGTDCRELFKEAYENRYTWDNDFPGYKGRCSWQNDKSTFHGSFILGKDLKAFVEGIDDELINKSISSQLWEVAIHRIRRPFEKIHSKNIFTYGGYDENNGIEVLVSGKNKGDKYNIKGKIITMVYRHIHGNLINIFTDEVFETGEGYLSKKYTSQYLDPSSAKPVRAKNNFNDEYTALDKNGPWVLSKRKIETESQKETFSFFDLQKIN
tara:strand:- start:5989 stop:6651 length:663 start_codon:yes stop_codon:yes gene_type:complete